MWLGVTFYGGETVVSDKHPPARYATIAAAAEHLGVAPKTIRRLIASGRLPAYRISHRLVRVSLKDLDALVQSTRTPWADSATHKS